VKLIHCELFRAIAGHEAWRKTKVGKKV